MSPTRPRAAVCILARAPSVAGKTRLTDGLSAERALALRRALFLDTFEAAQASGAPVIVCFTPSTARDELEALVRPSPAGPPILGCRLIPQSDGDLGARMRSAFQDTFALGFDRVVLIGSDLPTLPPQRLVDAMAALDHAPAVIGPSEDGGYYLIGLRAPAPTLFEGIVWGTPRVLSQTEAAARAAALPLAHVAPWYDVDAPAELRRVARSDRARHTCAWLEPNPTP